MSANEDKITAFWKWFVKSEKVIKECIELDSSPNQDYIVHEMNELILDLGVFTWDVGLDDFNDWFLTISPNGNSDYLKVSQEIILAAPNHMNWTFHSSKPAKVWDRKFLVYSFEMEEYSIDAGSWEFVISNNEENTIDLIIVADNLAHLDPDTAELAANQFLVSELGELTTIRRIGSVSIVEKIEERREPIANLIASVKS